MDRADNHRETTNQMNRIDFEDILLGRAGLSLSGGNGKKRERENRELNRFDGEIVSFDSWKSRPPLFHFFVFLFNPL